MDIRKGVLGVRKHNLRPCPGFLTFDRVMVHRPNWLNVLMAPPTDEDKATAIVAAKASLKAK